MSDMPERIWAGRDEDPSRGNNWWFEQEGDVHHKDEYIRADLVAEKDAEIERLRKALDQAIDRADLRVAKAADVGYYELLQHLPVLRQLSPDLYDYLREKEEGNGN